MAGTRRRVTPISAPFLLGPFRGNVVRDAETQERSVRESALGRDDRPAGNSRLSYADAAHFMLRQVADADYVRATVGLFY